MLNVTINQVDNGFLILDQVTDKYYVAAILENNYTSIPSVIDVLRKLIEEHQPKQKD